MNKNILIALTLVAIIGASVFAVSRSIAADGTYPPIVQRIADKFNLKPDEVKQVFDEQKTENQANRKQKFEDRLNQAVTDGKITDVQKTEILTKADEMKTKLESLKDLTPEERHIQMKSLREELVSWAKEKGIDMKFMPMPGKFGHGFKMGYKMGQNLEQ